jgi:hypothetical protein
MSVVRSCCSEVKMSLAFVAVARLYLGMLLVVPFCSLLASYSYLVAVSCHLLIIHY